MGRPPGNGGPAFRFTPSEVSEMEVIMLEHDNKLPPRDRFVTLAEKFSNGPERFGKSTVQMKQVMNWFQNKRYALKAKSSKATPKLDIAPLQAVPPLTPAQAPVLQHTPPVLQEVNGSPASNIPRSFAPLFGKALNNAEFEARSARDGAWYDVAAFLAVKNKDTDDPEVLVSFAGLTSEEDEWIKVSKHVRHRSLPCEASECVAVLPGDLILCFQEAPEQALYFDAHVLDAQRLKHDSRNCRCQFLVRFDHDQSEEAVPLKKICRRPETEYRLQIYQALRDLPAQQKVIVESTPCLVQTGQAESVPKNEKVANVHQKLTFFGAEKSAGVPVDEANDDRAPKAAHKAEEILDQDVANKKARKSDEKENRPEDQIVTQNAEKMEAAAVDISTITSPKEAAAAAATATPPEEDHAKSSAAVEEGSNSSNPAASVTCQNQTNGHNNPNAGSSGSSDVPVGAQRFF